MGKIIAIANQKGGVGKTTTAVNLSAALAQLGKSVLLIDCDPQGNATSGVGVDKNSLKTMVYDLFLGDSSVSSITLKTEIENLSLIPANSDLVGAEIELSSKIGRELILKTALSKVTSCYDYIFIDCPPSLGLLTLNAFVAADSILIALQAEYYALEGVSALMQTIDAASAALNPNLSLEGVVLTMYDGRTNLSRQVEVETREFFASKVFKSVIPRNVRLSESPSFGKPIVTYDPNSAGSLAYKALAEEFIKRNKKKPLKQANLRA